MTVMAAAARTTVARTPHVVIAAVAYFVLAIAQTWPLSLHLSDRIPHDLGDPILIAYLVNWNARVMPLTEQWWHPPFFWPAQNTITLSDPYLSIAPAAWLMTTLGATPAAVYNMLFVAAFWLSPLAMYLFAHFLTGDRVASFIAGLAFGFAPYRASQLPHLQMLLVPAIPLFFLALHRAIGSNGIRWAFAAAALWLWQAFVGLYFLLFLPLALPIWLAWFAGLNRRAWMRVILGFVTVSLLSAAVILRYRESHGSASHARAMSEVVVFSADVMALTQSTTDLRVQLAGRPGNRPEQDLFPGIGVLVLAVVALGGVRVAKARISKLTAAFLLLALVASALATVAILNPFTFRLLGITVSLTSPHKSLAVVWVSLLAALLTSHFVTTARHERSFPLGYAIIGFVLWLFALGPDPTVNGMRLWYRSPWWFLFEYVPGFDGLRVPARLWTLVTLCLAVLAAAGAQRLLQNRWRLPGAAIVATWLVVEGWVAPLHLERLPDSIDIPSEAEVVLELPAGDPYDDAAAMFRSLSHLRPVLNGYSGYSPAAYGEFLDRLAKSDASTIIEAGRGKRVAVILNQPLDAATPLYQAVMVRAENACDTEGGATICVLPALRR